MAFTDLYVTSAGAGDNSGSSEANAMPWDTMVSTIVAAGAGGSAGIRYNVKGAVSRTTTTQTISGGGTATSPLVIRGYTTTIGDGYLGRTNGSGPLITTNMPGISYTTGTLTVSATLTIIESLNITGARNGATVTVSGMDSCIHWCSVANAAAGASGIALVGSGARAGIIDCDVTLSNGGNAGSSAINSTGTAVRIIGCRVTSTAVGINANNAGSTRQVFVNNTVFNCTGVGIASGNTAADGVMLGNTITGGASDGIDIVAGTTGIWVLGNNCVTDNGGYGFDLNNANVGTIMFNNRTRDNTSGPINLGTDWVSATNFAVVTTDNGGPETDYVNSILNDYRLLSSSAATNAGLPALASIGALQRGQLQVSSTFTG